MLQHSSPLRAQVRSFLYLLVLSLLVWLALTSTLQLQEVAVGIAICLVLSVWLSKHYLPVGLPPLSARRLVFFLVYLAVLLLEIIKANLDVAYRVVHPRMPINPGIVVIKTGLKSDLGRMILANSITLTPGTFTLDVRGDSLLIHWINVKTGNIEEATALIGERFEKYLRVIFD